MTVQCCKAGKFNECKQCPHSESHEPITVGSEFCTKWGECVAGEDYCELKKVRCITVRNPKKTIRK